jgi:hypothetical protein
MPRMTAQVLTAGALANGNAIAGVVPAAAANFKITGVVLGVSNAGGAITDFDLSVGLNRATARGTSSGTATLNRSDPNSGASQITAVDNAWSVQPTLAAADGWLWSFNSRGGLALNFNEWDIVSTVGTANPLVFVQRSGAALPAGHSITLTVAWLD